LDEVATGVIEYRDDSIADVCGGLGKGDAFGGQPFVLGFDVIYCELSQRDALLNEGFAVRLDRWVAGWLKEEFGAV
jgi:hypothetical protein